MKIHKVFDPAYLEMIEEDGQYIRNYQVAEVDIYLERPIVVDRFAEIPEMGRFVLERADCLVGGGIVV